MISIPCQKHRDETQRLAVEAGLPPYISNETHGHLPEKELDDLLVEYGRFMATLEGHDDCSDCRIVGLSKRGMIEDLDSPNDWIFS